jgi:tetratricopeptide (TPR) repeat protein
MASRETPAARIERLLATGDAAGAIAAANELLARSPGSFIGLLGRARAHLRLRDNIAAELDLNAALAISPNDDLALLLRANMDFHLGRTEPALAAMRRVAGGRSPHASEAAINLLEALHGAGRHDEHSEFVRKGGAWTKDERAQLHVARTRFREDAEAGIEAL